MNRRRQRKSGGFFFAFTSVLFAILAVGLSIFVLAGDWALELPQAAGPSRLSIREAPETSRIAPDGFPQFTLEVPLAEITDTQYLKLVNRERPIAVAIRNGKLVPVFPDIPASSAYVTLHETAFSAMRELFGAAQNANIGSLFIASGFRSDEEQSYLYHTLGSHYAMPPGHSEHQLGLAADIALSDFRDMRGAPEAQWLAENAPLFGLILRYPEDKQDITGVVYEPWHFRYVGRVHAWYMMQRDFVLEEYIEYLQATGGGRVEFAGKTYYVLYQRPENGMILVPDGLNFWVSSANTGGLGRA